MNSFEKFMKRRQSLRIMRIPTGGTFRLDIVVMLYGCRGRRLVEGLPT